MAGNKTIKARVIGLEARRPKKANNIRINWGEIDYSDLKPGDIIITWNQDDEITKEIIGHDKAQKPV